MRILKLLLIISLAILPGISYGSPPPEIINIQQRQDSVGLYEKFEVSLNLQAEFVNPFDPDEIDITATFTSPAGKEWKINGFYYYTSGMLWKIRFSPNETGLWKYSVRVRDKNGETTSEPKSFKTSAI